MSYVIDTNVVSELARPTPNRAVVDWFATQRSIALSAVSIEELAYGIARARSAERRRLAPWFEALLAVPAEILPVDERVARAAGELRAARERVGRTVAQADMLIAATAIVAGRTLVTCNTRDFEGCGVTIFDPFA
jgi:predicted nucleic acid-binding protein